MTAQPPPRPTYDVEFDVKKIVKHKRNSWGVLLLRVHWEGYPPSQDTWEPLCNLACAVGGPFVEPLLKYARRSMDQDLRRIVLGE